MSLSRELDKKYVAQTAAFDSTELAEAEASAVSHAAAGPARIGPNSLIQTVRALQERYPAATIAAILQQSGQAYLLHHDPEAMVQEQEFAALVQALADQLGVSAARAVLHRSGQLTAAYLLQYRIPRPFQRLLKLLPHRLALKLLLFAISKNAWTFAGSGHFSYQVGKTSRLTVTGHIQPLEAVCGFYGGTFEHLIHVLIHAKAIMQTEVSMTGGQTYCVYAFNQL